MRSPWIVAALGVACGPARSNSPPAVAVDCADTAQTRFGDVVITTEAKRAAARTGSFSSSPTSFEAPIETCGVLRQLDALLALRCDDGSRPYPDRETAHRVRAGSAEAGGRCGKAIDLYKVECPEKTYDVYMDLYHCTRAEVAEYRSTLAKFIDDGFEIQAPPGWEFRRAAWGAIGRRGDDRIAIVAGLGDAGFDLAAASVAARRELGIAAPLPAGERVAAGVLAEAAIEVDGRPVTVIELAPAASPDRAALLVARRGSPVIGELRDKLATVAASFARNPHHYREYEDLLDGDARDLKIVVDSHDGVLYAYPAGWRVVIKSAASFVATLDHDGAVVSFTHSRIARAELPASASDIARLLIGRFVNSIPVVIVYAGATAADGFRIVLVKESQWISLAVDRTREQWLISVMNGTRTSVLALSAIMLNEALAGAMANGLDPR